MDKESKLGREWPANMKGPQHRVTELLMSLLSTFYMNGHHNVTQAAHTHSKPIHWSP